IRFLIKRLLNTAENQRAVGICDIKQNHADCVISFAAKRLGKNVWVIAQSLRCFLNTRLGGGRNIAGERGVVQDDGNCAGCESALPCNIADGHCSLPRFLLLHLFSVSYPWANSRADFLLLSHCLTLAVQ